MGLGALQLCEGRGGGGGWGERPAAVRGLGGLLGSALRPARGLRAGCCPCRCCGVHPAARCRPCFTSWAPSLRDRSRGQGCKHSVLQAERKESPEAAKKKLCEAFPLKGHVYTYLLNTEVWKFLALNIHRLFVQKTIALALLIYSWSALVFRVRSRSC